MDRTDSPFNYLAVIPPGPPKGNIRSQDVTAERIARHVAVVFGVDVPENPAKRTWVADYERLRVNEIARGALSGTPEADESGKFGIDLDVIATATLQKYGPDNKAAIVLAGCEVLFNSVTQVFHDVLGIIGTSEDNEPVATPTIFAAWALLVADTFRAQPALMAAAMQARSVQSKASLDWRMAPTTLPLATSERPRDLIAAEMSTIYPQELSVLDRTLPPDLTILRPGHGSDVNQKTLITSLINNWCYYILGSADQAIAWISPERKNPQSHRAEAFMPLTEPARTFVSDVLAVSPYVQPMSDPRGFTRAKGWELFKQSTGENDGTFTDTGHTDRLLPRMYSIPEVSRLESRSQRALLMTHMSILQLYRVGDDFRSSYLRKKSRRDAGLIVQIAHRLWGPSDPMAIMLAMQAARMEWSDLENTLDPATGLKLSNVIIDGFASISRHWHSGTVSDAVWIGLLFQCSADLREAIDSVETTDKSRSAELRHSHWEYWRTATEETGLREAWRRVFEDNSEPLPQTSITALLHNYMALPFRSSDPSVLMGALRFSREKLLPLRRRVTDSRRSEYAYRITLQTTVRPLYLLLALGVSPDDEAWLVATAEDFEQQLIETALGQYFFNEEAREQRDPNRSDLNYLGSLARVQISILEHRHLSRTPIDQLLPRAAATICAAWETYAEILQQEVPESDGVVTTSTDRRRFSEYAEYERRVRSVAEAEAESVTPETCELVFSMLSRAANIRESVHQAPDRSEPGQRQQ